MPRHTLDTMHTNPPPVTDNPAKTATAAYTPLPALATNVAIPATNVRRVASGAIVGEKPKSENPFEGWTTAEAAANQIQRTRSTVQYWINSGVIRSYRVGHNTILVNLEEIAEYSRLHPAR